MVLIQLNTKIESPTTHNNSPTSLLNYRKSHNLAKWVQIEVGGFFNWVSLQNINPCIVAVWCRCLINDLLTSLCKSGWVKFELEISCLINSTIWCKYSLTDEPDTPWAPTVSHLTGFVLGLCAPFAAPGLLFSGTVKYSLYTISIWSQEAPLRGFKWPCRCTFPSTAAFVTLRNCHFHAELYATGKLRTSRPKYQAIETRNQSQSTDDS